MVCVSSETLLKITEFLCKSVGDADLRIAVLGPQFELSLCRSCGCCHSLCEFICAPVLLFLEGAVSLVLRVLGTLCLTILILPLPSSCLSYEERSLIKISDLEPRVLSCSLSAQCQVVGLHISSCLLQEEAFLIAAKLDPDL